MKRTVLISGALLALLAGVECGSYSSMNNNGSGTPAPQFSPAPGAYAQLQPVSITDSAPGALIYYTTNGSMPTTASNLYRGPIILTTSTTINAIAVAATYNSKSSAVASAMYTINP